MSRPELNNQTSVDDFRDFYWLKEELVMFCRQYGLPTTGSKGEISARIEEFLTTGKIFKPEVRRKATADSMPNTFTRSTVIGSHWRCSQTLRAFFVKEIGSQFHFNKVMRDFIKQGAGKTLQEAIDAWHTPQLRSPDTETEIPLQFEYNRHIREFFKRHPDSTLEDAIRSWKEKKARRKSASD